MHTRLIPLTLSLSLVLVGCNSDTPKPVDLTKGINVEYLINTATYASVKNENITFTEEVPSCAQAAKKYVAHYNANPTSIPHISFSWKTEKNGIITSHNFEVLGVYHNERRNYLNVQDSPPKYTTQTVTYLDPELKPIKKENFRKQYEFIVVMKTEPFIHKSKGKVLSKDNAIRFGYDEDGYWGQYVWAEGGSVSLAAAGDNYIEKMHGKLRYNPVCQGRLEVNDEGQLEIYANDPST